LTRRRPLPRTISSRRRAACGQPVADGRAPMSPGRVPRRRQSEVQTSRFARCSIRRRRSHTRRAAAFRGPAPAWGAASSTRAVPTDRARRARRGS
jgi:hypothetical protein